jgi:hypothetical protein
MQHLSSFLKNQPDRQVNMITNTLSTNIVLIK